VEPRRARLWAKERLARSARLSAGPLAPQPVPSAASSDRDEVRVGTLLPGGVTLHAVPREYHGGAGLPICGLNDRAVIAEPRTRRVVEIID
jgi:hypothetical protein